MRKARKRAKNIEKKRKKQEKKQNEQADHFEIAEISQISSNNDGIIENNSPLDINKVERRDIDQVLVDTQPILFSTNDHLNNSSVQLVTPVNKIQKDQNDMMTSSSLSSSLNSECKMGLD